MSGADLPPEDRPSIDIVPIAPELADDHALGQPFLEPAGSANLFMLGLADPRRYFNALRNLTTPESWAAWRDYTAAAEMVEQELGEGWSITTRGERVGDDVAYVPLLTGMTEPVYYVLNETPVLAAAVISLVHRPSLGGWLVHAFGNIRFPPDRLPHD